MSGAMYRDLKENAMSNALVTALLGDDPGALAAEVSLATPLTAPRITGRDAVVAALGAYADVMGATDADLRLKGQELEGAVFTTTVEGHTAQILALVTREASGLIATIDIYGRPWPYMALVRERIAKIDPKLADPDLGTSPYVPEGPGTSLIDPPPYPALAEDVVLYSPVLSGEPRGKALMQRVLDAVWQCWGQPAKYRAVLQVEGQNAVAGVFDGHVDGGHVNQVAAVFTLNSQSEATEIRVFTRPWPITAYFRRCVYEKHILGDEFFQGPDPEAPLPIR